MDSESNAQKPDILSPQSENAEKGQMSPLTGAYLLIVLSEPHSAEDRDKIIRRLSKGLLCWDVESSHVDLNCELLNLTNAPPEGDIAKNGEKLIQWASENLVVEVLYHAQVNTLIQCVKNLLSSFTRYRHIIHAGYSYAGSGSWLLQDGTFSVADFTELWDEPEVYRLLPAYKSDITVALQCALDNGWSDARFKKEPFSKLCQLSVNGGEKLSNVHNAGVGAFAEYLSTLITPSPLKEILQPSEIVGNIRFSHPTLYVFPGGQGDAALFGVNGFNMLIDGGYSRKACFWDFTRHLDRLDAVLLTRVNNNDMGGIGALLERKNASQVFPQIGHFFGNVLEKKGGGSGNGEIEDLKDAEGSEGRDDLILSLTDQGYEMYENLRGISMKPHFCSRENLIEPINLYHKVGHGKLDMYILNPVKDSKELKEFLSKWKSENGKHFASSKINLREGGAGALSKETPFPVLNLVSICALLVWQPANPHSPITRILFPGSTPQQKIFDSLSKLKHLEFLRYPVCNGKTLAAAHKSTVKSEKIITEVKRELKSKEGSYSYTTIESKVYKSVPKEAKTGQNKKQQLLSSGATRSDTNSTTSVATIGDSGVIKGDEPVKKEPIRKTEKTKTVSKVISTTTTSMLDNKVRESRLSKFLSSSKTPAPAATKVSSKPPVGRKVEPKEKAELKEKAEPEKSEPIKDSSTSSPVKDLNGTEKPAPEKITEKPAVEKIMEKPTPEKPVTKYGIGKSLSKTSAATEKPPTSSPKQSKEDSNRKVIEHKARAVSAAPKTDAEKPKPVTQKVEAKCITKDSKIETKVATKESKVEKTAIKESKTTTRVAPKLGAKPPAGAKAPPPKKPNEERPVSKIRPGTAKPPASVKPSGSIKNGGAFVGTGILAAGAAILGGAGAAIVLEKEDKLDDVEEKASEETNGSSSKSPISEEDDASPNSIIQVDTALENVKDSEVKGDTKITELDSTYSGPTSLDEPIISDDQERPSTVASSVDYATETPSPTYTATTDGETPKAALYLSRDVPDEDDEEDEYLVVEKSIGDESSLEPEDYGGKYENGRGSSTLDLETEEPQFSSLPAFPTASTSEDDETESFGIEKITTKPIKIDQTETDEVKDVKSDLPKPAEVEEVIEKQTEGEESLVESMGADEVGQSKAEQTKTESPEEVEAETLKTEKSKPEEPKAEPTGFAEVHSETTELEEVKTDATKIEEIKADPTEGVEIESEATKFDEVKADRTKVEEVEAQPIKIEEVETELTKVEEVKGETYKIDEVEAEPTKVEEVKAEPTKIEEVETATTEVEELKVEVTKIDEVKAEVNKIDEVQAESTKFGEFKVDPSQIEEFKAEVSQVEEVKAGLTNAEEVKAEPTKITDVKEESTKTEDDKTESTKIEETQVEPTKIEKVKVEPTVSGEVKADTAKPEEVNTGNTEINKIITESIKVGKLEEVKEDSITVKAVKPITSKENEIDAASNAEVKAEPIKIEEVKAEKPKIEKVDSEPAKVKEVIAATTKIEEVNAEPDQIDKIVIAPPKPQKEEEFKEEPIRVKEVTEVKAEPIKSKKIQAEVVQAEPIKVDELQKLAEPKSEKLEEPKTKSETEPVLTEDSKKDTEDNLNQQPIKIEEPKIPEDSNQAAELPSHIQITTGRESVSAESVEKLIISEKTSVQMQIPSESPSQLELSKSGEFEISKEEDLEDSLEVKDKDEIESAENQPESLEYDNEDEPALSGDEAQSDIYRIPKTTEFEIGVSEKSSELVTHEEKAPSPEFKISAEISPIPSDREIKGQDPDLYSAADEIGKKVSAVEKVKKKLFSNSEAPVPRDSETIEESREVNLSRTELELSTDQIPVASKSESVPVTSDDGFKTNEEKVENKDDKLKETDLHKDHDEQDILIQKMSPQLMASAPVDVKTFGKEEEDFKIEPFPQTPSSSFSSIFPEPEVVRDGSCVSLSSDSLLSHSLEQFERDLEITGSDFLPVEKHAPTEIEAEKLEELEETIVTEGKKDDIPKTRGLKRDMIRISNKIYPPEEIDPEVLKSLEDAIEEEAQMSVMTSAIPLSAVPLDETPEVDAKGRCIEKPIVCTKMSLTYDHTVELAQEQLESEIIETETMVLTSKIADPEVEKTAEQPVEKAPAPGVELQKPAEPSKDDKTPKSRESPQRAECRSSDTVPELEETQDEIIEKIISTEHAQPTSSEARRDSKPDEVSFKISGNFSEISETDSQILGQYARVYGSEESGFESLVPMKKDEGDSKGEKTGEEKIDDEKDKLTKAGLDSELSSKSAEILAETSIMVKGEIVDVKVEEKLEQIKTPTEKLSETKTDLPEPTSTKSPREETTELPISGARKESKVSEISTDAKLGHAEKIQIHPGDFPDAAHHPVEEAIRTDLEQLEFKAAQQMRALEETETFSQIITTLENEPLSANIAKDKAENLKSAEDKGEGIVSQVKASEAKENDDGRVEKENIFSEIAKTGDIHFEKEKAKLVEKVESLEKVVTEEVKSTMTVGSLEEAAAEKMESTEKAAAEKVESTEKVVIAPQPLEQEQFQDTKDEQGVNSVTKDVKIHLEEKRSASFISGALQEVKEHEIEKAGSAPTETEPEILSEAVVSQHSPAPDDQQIKGIKSDDEFHPPGTNTECKQTPQVDQHEPMIISSGTAVQPVSKQQRDQTRTPDEVAELPHFYEVSGSTDQFSVGMHPNEESDEEHGIENIGIPYPSSAPISPGGISPTAKKFEESGSIEDKAFKAEIRESFKTETDQEIERGQSPSELKKLSQSGENLEKMSEAAKYVEKIEETMEKIGESLEKSSEIRHENPEKPNESLQKVGELSEEPKKESHTAEHVDEIIGSEESSQKIEQVSQLAQNDENKRSPKAGESPEKVEDTTKVGVSPKLEIEPTEIIACPNICAEEVEKPEAGSPPASNKSEEAIFSTEKALMSSVAPAPLRKESEPVVEKQHDVKVPTPSSHELMLKHLDKEDDDDLLNVIEEENEVMSPLQVKSVTSVVITPSTPPVSRDPVEDTVDPTRKASVPKDEALQEVDPLEDEAHPKDDANHGQSYQKFEYPEHSEVQADDPSKKSGVHDADLPQKSPVKTDEPSQKSPVPTDDSSQKSPVPTEDSSQKSPVPTDDSSQKSPVPTEDSSQKSPVPTEDSSQKLPVPTDESSQKSPVPTEDLSQKSPVRADDPSQQSQGEASYKAVEQPHELVEKAALPGVDSTQKADAQAADSGKSEAHDVDPTSKSDPTSKEGLLKGELLGEAPEKAKPEVGDERKQSVVDSGSDKLLFEGNETKDSLIDSLSKEIGEVGGRNQSGEELSFIMETNRKLDPAGSITHSLGTDETETELFKHSTDDSSVSSSAITVVSQIIEKAEQEVKSHHTALTEMTTSFLSESQEKKKTKFYVGDSDERHPSEDKSDEEDEPHLLDDLENPEIDIPEGEPEEPAFTGSAVKTGLLAAVTTLSATIIHQQPEVEHVPFSSASAHSSRDVSPARSVASIESSPPRKTDFHEVPSEICRKFSITETLVTETQHARELLTADSHASESESIRKLSTSSHEAEPHLSRKVSPVPHEAETDSTRRLSTSVDKTHTALPPTQSPEPTPIAPSPKSDASPPHSAKSVKPEPALERRASTRSSVGSEFAFDERLQFPGDTSPAHGHDAEPTAPPLVEDIFGMSVSSSVSTEPQKGVAESESKEINEMDKIFKKMTVQTSVELPAEDDEESDAIFKKMKIHPESAQISHSKEIHPIDSAESVMDEPLFEKTTVTHDIKSEMSGLASAATFEKVKEVMLTTIEKIGDAFDSPIGHAQILRDQSRERQESESSIDEPIFEKMHLAPEKLDFHVASTAHALAESKTDLRRASQEMEPHRSPEPSLLEPEVKSALGSAFTTITETQRTVVGFGADNPQAGQANADKPSTDEPDKSCAEERDKPCADKQDKRSTDKPVTVDDKSLSTALSTIIETHKTVVGIASAGADKSAEHFGGPEMSSTSPPPALVETAEKTITEIIGTALDMGRIYEPLELSRHPQHSSFSSSSTTTITKVETTKSSGGEIKETTTTFTVPSESLGEPINFENFEKKFGDAVSREHDTPRENLTQFTSQIVSATKDGAVITEGMPQGSSKFDTEFKSTKPDTTAPDSSKYLGGSGDLKLETERVRTISSSSVESQQSSHSQSSQKSQESGVEKGSVKEIADLIGQEKHDLEVDLFDSPGAKRGSITSSRRFSSMDTPETYHHISALQRRGSEVVGISHLTPTMESSQHESGASFEPITDERDVTSQKARKILGMDEEVGYGGSRGMSSTHSIGDHPSTSSFDSAHQYETFIIGSDSEHYQKTGMIGSQQLPAQFQISGQNPFSEFGAPGTQFSAIGSEFSNSGSEFDSQPLSLPYFQETSDSLAQSQSGEKQDMGTEKFSNFPGFSDKGLPGTFAGFSDKEVLGTFPGFSDKDIYESEWKVTKTMTTTTKIGDGPPETKTVVTSSDSSGLPAGLQGFPEPLSGSGLPAGMQAFPELLPGSGTVVRATHTIITKIGDEPATKSSTTVVTSAAGASGSTGLEGTSTQLPGSVRTTTTSQVTAEEEDILKKWGKPLGLPGIHPEDVALEKEGGNEGRLTPRKDGRSSGRTPSTPKSSSQSGKPAAKQRSNSKGSKNLKPIYVDLAYVPHHGNSNYSDSEFFRLIRSRYYVFSGLEPSREVFDGLLQGKQEWEDKNLDVTIVPTYDTDTLGYWVVDSEVALAEGRIDLAPSASRCTINLQDHETSCSAYRLEF